MKSKILMYSLIALFAMGCSSDPCDDLNNIECATGDADGDGILNSVDSAPEDPCLPDDNEACPTGDLDGDGVINSEDSAPLDACVPNALPFAENVIGTWDWSTLGGSGVIRIDADGTFTEVEGEILSNGDVTERTWSVEGFIMLKLRVLNSDGLAAGLNLNTISFECDKMTFEGFFTDLVFTRQ